MIRLGLCCIFSEQPIEFRRTTAAASAKRGRQAALEKLSELCLHNAASLLQALEYCRANGIGAFRVNSQILPLKTHPVAGYDIAELPNSAEIVSQFRACGEFAIEHNLRTSFHPDQFVVLSAHREPVVDSSLAELEYQAEVAEWIGADVINVHAGGAYGDKAAALARLERNLDRLSPRARSRLTLENDDVTYTPADLLPLCRRTGVPLVYDAHHHRCHPDGVTVEDATALALETWRREPHFHISSPRDGWSGHKPQRHHDYIDPADFPACWRSLDITLDVEAKAKELAVLQLKRDLAKYLSAATR